MVENNENSDVTKVEGAQVGEIKKYKVGKDETTYKKPILSKNVQTFLYMFLSAMFFAVGYHYFVATCKFAPGGLPGIVAMIQHWQHEVGIVSENSSNFDYSTLIMIAVNVPLLIIASKSLGKEFSIKTFITALIMTATMFILSNIDKGYWFSITQTPEVTDVGTRLVSAILGGAFGGLSLACALKVNASTGGADVVGAMLQKKNPHMGVGTMIFAVNSVILAVSIFVYKDNLMPVFLSLIYMFATSVVCDFIMQGSKSALKFEVITEHAEEISRDIIEEIGHGVTITPAKGMFEHKDKNLLICVIKPRQIAKFQSVIKRYPDTFAYVGSVNEIIGKFNRGSK